MASRNDVTGDALVSKANTDKYAKGYEGIFGKPKPRKTVVLDLDEVEETDEEELDETEESCDNSDQDK